jgi:hypothetical protein
MMQTSRRHPQDVREKAENFARQRDFDHRQIEIAAYLMAQHRGFTPGHELDDWLEAEREFDSLIASYGRD